MQTGWPSYRPAVACDAIAAALLEEGRGEASAEVVEDLEEAVRMHEEV